MIQALRLITQAFRRDDSGLTMDDVGVSMHGRDRCFDAWRKRYYTRRRRFDARGRSFDRELEVLKMHGAGVSMRGVGDTKDLWGGSVFWLCVYSSVLLIRFYENYGGG